MAKNIVPQVQDMSKQGFSVRDIADALKVDRQRVETILADLTPEPEAKNWLAVSQIESLESAEEEVEGELEEIAEEVEMTQAQLQENPKQKSLKDHLKDLIKKEEELTRMSEELQKEREQLEKIKDHLPEREEAYNAYQQRMFKERAMARYQYLLEELLNDSTNSRWKGIEVDAYLEQLETLREKLAQFCNFNRIDERRLVIYAGLGYLINLVERIQKKQTKGLFAGTSVMFNLGEETRTQITGYTATSFEQEIEVEAVNPFDKVLL